MIPTDEIYGAIFDLNSDPYSEQAQSIGYESRYVVLNTGSLLFYLVVISMQLTIYSSILRCLSRESWPKLRSIAAGKRSAFLWAGAVDFFSELFLNIAFSVGINTSAFNFTNASVCFNNVFAVVLGVLMVAGPVTISVPLAV